VEDLLKKQQKPGVPNTTEKSMNESFEITVHKGSKFATITVKSSDQVSEIRNKYTDKEGVKTKGSILLYKAKLMEDGKLLADYDIFPGSGSIPTVMLVMKSDGGSKKK